MTDQTDLTSIIFPQTEFINVLVEKLDNIPTHSFIARFQPSYLKKLKNMIDADEVIVLGNFAENYSFLGQEKIQGYHWNRSQCSPSCCCVYSFQ